ncbi:MAG: Hsp70 family protein, partial [Deltaproteobacteria bacterium]|nr:Hsp70 family protein [Deltaproteobacteria bacterium]
RSAVLGTDGVGLAGDAFDAAIVRNVIAPAFGNGTDQRTPFGKVFPLPGWVFVHLERWHQLTMLGVPSMRRRLRSILREAEHPELFGALVHVVENELAFQLVCSVQTAKADLSREDSTRLVFVDEDVCIDAPIQRSDFEAWIAPELAEMDAAVTRLLAKTGVTPGDVDRVFLTGGSSFVPAVRRQFADRFGAAKLASGDELTSVARGLALSGL